MRVEQGKFGNYFELDIKDDKTEEFFKSLEETLLIVGGSCLGEKPWNIKSPLINYGGSYTVRCKIYPNSLLGNLKVGRYEHGYCEITPPSVLRQKPPFTISFYVKRTKSFKDFFSRSENAIRWILLKYQEVYVQLQTFTNED